MAKKMKTIKEARTIKKKKKRKMKSKNNRRTLKKSFK